MGREGDFAYSALAPLVGALITLMNSVNGRFSRYAGSLVSTLVIHLVGLAAVSVLLLARREVKRPGRLPAYYYLGGLVGVGTVFSTIYAFNALGASLAVALSLLGQTLFSVAADASGIAGRKRSPLSARRLLGIGLAIAGAAVMAENWRSSALAMLVALIMGVLTGLSFILNSELGRRKGILWSTRANYIAGFAATMAIALAVRPSIGVAARGIAMAGPLLALGGGLMGVAVVASINSIFPHILAFSATLLLFSGQALAGVVIDAVAEGAFDARKLGGTLLVLAGLAADSLLARRAAGRLAETEGGIDRKA
jgi:transporter family-2 protein